MKHLKSPIATGFSSGHKEFSNKCTFCLDEMLPKGTVLIECGKLLQRAGYRIKVLNTINFKKSMHYKNQMEWVRQMNACKAQAEEIVKAELIYD